MAFIPILAKGLLSFVPGTRGLFSRHSGGSCSARYCYSVWLRHLCKASELGLLAGGVPRIVAEIGPGDSLGMGVAALMSGCEAYRAFDVVRSSNAFENVRIFDELAELFQMQANIPDDIEFPNVSPRLSSYIFPSEILPKARLQVLLNQQRLKAIRGALEEMTPEGKQSELISYTVPWSTLLEQEELCVDMIFSQAVMEHVEDLSGSYSTMFRWLKPGGFISHQIDFKCHNTANRWNGHWAYSKFMWACVKGRRPFLINRAPLSTHLALVKQSGFEIIHSCTRENGSGITRKELARDFADISDEDFITSGVFLQARKLVRTT